MQIRLPFVVQDVDRHGNVRVYFRRRGLKKVRIHEVPGTPEFSETYHRLMEQAETGALSQAVEPGIKGGTYRWLCTQYFASPEFRRLDARTQRANRGVIESTFTELVRPDRKEVFADYPLATMKAKAIRVLRDRKADLPGAADKRVKLIRRVFSWGMGNDLIDRNPAEAVTLISPSTGGFHTWTPEEIKQFEARHTIGTRARLALTVLLLTGVRRSDAVLLGRQHVRLVVNPQTGIEEKWLKFVAQKNKNRRPVTIEIPMLPALEQVIAQSPTGDLAFISTESGKPFGSGDSFGNWFRDCCREAGLEDCSAHGLRKAGATFAAENGATAYQLMSIYGWTTLQQAERYTKAAERKRMAGQAMGLLIRPNGKQSVPPLHANGVPPDVSSSEGTEKLRSGGCDRDRTCDPYHVKVVLYR